MINDREVDRVDEALTQMKAIILEFVKHSIQGDVYEKAIECLRSMRKACKDNDEAQPFNEFLKVEITLPQTNLVLGFKKQIRNRNSLFFLRNG